jgi:hypothetical protein
MHVDPSLALVVSSVIGIVAALSLMLIGLLWARVRAMPVEQTTRRVDDLARRQESIESLLIKLDTARDPEAARRGPAQTQLHRGAASAIGGPTLITIPSLSALGPEATATATAAVAAELGRRFGAIWALADSGQSAEAIARTTGQPVGQVELILGLRRQLFGQSAGRT